MQTQVGIIGAGPAGLILSHLLHLAGISSVIIEARDRAYVEHRIRAGVLEHAVADLLVETGLGARLKREGLTHDGIELRFNGANHRVDFRALTGRGVTVYGQHEVVKDVIAARIAAGGEILFEAEAHEINAETGLIRYTHAGKEETLNCDFIAGCDGFHGLARASIPDGQITLYDRIYPFGWLGILADAEPAQEELIYANHPHGFSLFSMRSPTVSRLYLQVDPHDDVANWSDDRIWSELRARLGANEGIKLNEGKITQKGITAMRSFVAEPMRFGKLFLAGDAAHIVPPTGAKGMNLAVADIVVLSRALKDYYAKGTSEGLDSYSATCLRRIWRAQHFSYWMTSMLHNFPESSSFDRKRQLAELDAVTSSRFGATYLAENYTGIPLPQ
jgi:p-hydroxybenzoate 3-monooxygenase